MTKPRRMRSWCLNQVIFGVGGHFGATTFGVMTLSIMTFSIMTFKMIIIRMSFGTKTLSITMIFIIT